MFSNIKLPIRIVLLLSFIILIYKISFSQSNGIRDISLSHPLNFNPVKKQPKNLIGVVPDTLYVYGVRVQFTQHSDPNTTGDGTFDLTNNYPDSVDAPPHDSTYFANHFEFLKNYYYKASKGKLIIIYQLLGNIRTLPHIMADYSPRRGENNLRLGNLFFDVWRSVDSIPGIFSGINPSKSAFVIFHAGVGKDVDLKSQGIFQGEFDIPSIYMSNNTLKSIYGDTTRGYYTHSGIIIPSSSILPEQEYRIINGGFGDVFLELGLNGILTATIGSHLGLPDLFNTQTGNTSIGRFGLMDGQSIFSYSGVFPPEPSAWEKTYLGWVNPIVIYQNGTYSSRAASLDNGNTSVYKILIDAKEYFLIENRNRDANKNGEKIYFRSNGILDSISFIQDEDGFQNGDVWRLRKNIVDVDELDWSLPGLKNDTAFYLGGLLIWHIDENVIDANIASNTINNDINHRGVKVVEAKGSQDIGVIISTPLGQFIDDGVFYDFWYNGQHYVPSTIYQNAFTPTTIPNSKSYSNFNSRICLTNFSPIDSSMTFVFQQCASVTNINNYPRFVGFDTTGNAQPIGFDFNGNGQDEVFINVKDSLYGFRDNGNPIRVDVTNGFLKDSVSNFVVSNVVNSSGQKFVAGNYKNQFCLISFTIDSLTGNPTIIKVLGTGVLMSPILYNPTTNLIISGTIDGKVDKFDINALSVSFDSITNFSITELSQGSTGNYTVPKKTYKYVTLGKITGGQIDDTIIVTNDNQLTINGMVISGNLGITQIYSTPIVCDLNKNGHQVIIFCADDKVFAVNQYGILIDNFPFKTSGVSKISSGCSVADLDGDGVNEVIFGTGDGRVYAYSTTGKILDGFPLLCGKEIKATPAIINSGGNFGIIAYSQDGYLYGWKTGYAYDASRILWRNYLNDTNHKNSNFNTSTYTASGPCLPSDKVYNWPNPVYGTTTNIRYFLNGTASKVNVKILDLSGELVTTLVGSANSGYDNEVAWNVSNVQTGIYIAVLQLVNGTCNETASIKIAVVK